MSDIAAKEYPTPASFMQQIIAGVVGASILFGAFGLMIFLSKREMDSMRSRLGQCVEWSSFPTAKVLGMKKAPGRSVAYFYRMRLTDTKGQTFITTEPVEPILAKKIVDCPAGS